MKSSEEIISWIKETMMEDGANFNADAIIEDLDGVIIEFQSDALPLYDDYGHENGAAKESRRVGLTHSEDRYHVAMTWHGIHDGIHFSAVAKRGVYAENSDIPESDEGFIWLGNDAPGGSVEELMKAKFQGHVNEAISDNLWATAYLMEQAAANGADNPSVDEIGMKSIGNINRGLIWK